MEICLFNLCSFKDGVISSILISFIIHFNYISGFPRMKEGTNNRISAAPRGLNSPG